jgi:dihydrofolate reductase
MRKIIVGAQVFMDGVMQAPGGPTEDPTNGFKFGGWAMLYFDQESFEELDRVFKNFDLLLGRKTYEISPGTGPTRTGRTLPMAASPSSSMTSRSTRFRAQARSIRAGRARCSLRDLAEIKRLKQEDGPNLVTQGSTELVHALLANDLVDAMSLFTVPVVLGGGKKLFADGSAPHSFRLTRSRISPKGVIVGHYKREADIKIDDTLYSPSEREIARQERMKREGERFADAADPVSVLSADLFQRREAKQQLLDSSLALERDDDLVVRPGWLAGDDDAVAELRVADVVAGVEGLERFFGLVVLA